MSELKPCPFCGCDKIRFVERFYVSGGSYDCSECGCSTEYKQTRERALVAWDNRAESTELTALREQVKVLREACETAKECLDNNGFGKAYVQDFLNEALSQTKPKDEMEAKL